ncbi:MAG: succinylglutamate desuccinylase/aspartoacylase family protein [Formosimonas sp.]
MRTETIPLPSASIGQSFELTALHFGDETASRKVYIQASLHADELPGALVCHHLRTRLAALSEHITSHITVVPMANPIGLAQQLLHTPQGRFELGTGQNFNRLGELSLLGLTLRELESSNTLLGADAEVNTALIRAAMQRALAKHECGTQLEAMHLALLKLAFDADVVIDLHCDWRAVMHVYTTPEGWRAIEPLARYLGSECQLIANDSGCNPFDEALSTVWMQLAHRFTDANITAACSTTTVELRGQADVTHEHATQDADAIIEYLKHENHIALPAAPAPALLNDISPLNGVARVAAPCGGVVVYHVTAGDRVTAGQLIAEVINPVAHEATAIHSTIDGFVYACGLSRYTKLGDAIMSISGHKDLGHATLSA